jgi:two-component system chemotaxis sensor kinase CheA
MQRWLRYLILPSEITDFERRYLARVNRVALIFFALHVPAFVLIAWLNGTRPLAAALLTAAVLAGPAIAHHTLDNPRTTSVIHGITAMFMGGLLVHFGQGPVQIEMHFYFFSLIAMCAVFANPLVIVAAAVTVALHHLLVWLVLPRSVFNYDASGWVVAVHAAFVVLESTAACIIARSFFDNVIGLDRIVQARTAALDAKNQEMRLLLDNVEQGFLTINRQARLAQERSAAVDRWFRAPAPGATWFDYLSTLSPEFAAQSRLAWQEVVDDVMPVELTLEQMPRRLALGPHAHYRVDYRPIESAIPSLYLVIVTDITADVERELAEQEASERIALFQRLLVDRRGFETFFDEGAHIVDLLVNERTADLSTIRRAIHTLKGSAGLYGLTSLVTMSHDLETFIEQERRAPATTSYVALQERWKRLSADREALLGGRPSTIEVDHEQYEALKAAVRAGEPAPALLQRIRSLKLESTVKRLRHFEEHARAIAQRLGKTDVHVEVEDHGVRLDAPRWGAFWTTFIHAVRNAVDHGIEPAQERIAAGKPPVGQLALRTFQEADQIVIEITDDGKGIDWDALARRAEKIGLPTASTADIERALFTDGVSTAATVSEVSGRGIGMGALLEKTHSLGGEVAVQSAPGRGTTLRFTFPSSANVVDSIAPPAQVTN